MNSLEFNKLQFSLLNRVIIHLFLRILKNLIVSRSMHSIICKLIKMRFSGFTFTEIIGIKLALSIRTCFKNMISASYVSILFYLMKL